LSRWHPVVRFTPGKELEPCSILNSMDILFGLAAALCFGCADFCARFATRAIGTYRTLFYLQCVGFFILSLYLLFSGGLAAASALSWQPWVWGVLTACLNTLSYLALYKAFAIGKLAVVSPMAASYAAITVLLSLFAGEHLSPLQLLGIVAVLIGVVLAAMGNEEVAELSADVSTSATRSKARSMLPPGVDWALGAAVGFGLTYWLLGFTVVPTLGQVVPTWLFRLVGMLVFAPLTVLRRESLRLPRGLNLGLVIIIGLLDTGAFVAASLGLATGNVAIVSVLASLYSAVAVLLAAIFLREYMRRIQWLGVILLLAGVVLTHI
jgi:drug/metabolite transporter (DMT)-like permease